MLSQSRYRTLLLLVGWICLISPAGADVIRLHNGGEIRGELQDGPGGEDAVVVIRTLSGSIVSVDAGEVEFIQRRSPLLEEYVTRSRQIPASVEAHWDLAEWCRVQLLADQRTEQLELLLDLDPDHPEARRILGHVRHNGQWMTRDELMASRGYVRHKGKWITQQELDLIEKNSAERKAEVAWYPRVRLWTGWVTGNHESRRAEGYRQFEQLTDPDAIPAMNTAMSEGDREVRALYVRVLSGMQGPKPVKPLLDRYLLDADEQIRNEALAGLKPGQQPFAVAYLVSALGHESNEVIRRSATALGRMGDEAAVPALIKALVTTHRYKIQVASNNAMSFATTPSGQTGMVDPRLFSGSALPPELDLLARAGQLPHGAVVLPGPGTPPAKVRTVTIKAEIKNEDVLAALVALTGKNFGYNERDWQLWWSIEKS